MSSIFRVRSRRGKDAGHKENFTVRAEDAFRSKGDALYLSGAICAPWLHGSEGGRRVGKDEKRKDGDYT